MAFKRNIPAIGLAVLALALAAAFVLLSPSSESRLLQAARDHAATLGTPTRVEILGTVADIELAPDGQRRLLEFTRKDGKWTFSKDLAEDFDRHAQRPDVVRAVQERLAQRLAERFRGMQIGLKEGMRYYSVLSRDELGVAGKFQMIFFYPRISDPRAPEQQQQGRYEETFRYKNGTWTSEGPGRLVENPLRR